jgi:hypothetical protein
MERGERKFFGSVGEARVQFAGEAGPGSLEDVFFGATEGKPMERG